VSAALAPTVEYPLADCTAEAAPPANTPEWLEHRRTGIGGSDAAAVVGISRWKQPLDVWNDKLGLTESGPSTIAQRRGHALEPVLLGVYLEQTGFVSEGGGFYRSINLPYMFANPDSIIHRDNSSPACRGLELKSSDDPDPWGPEGSDTYPEDYFLQCQHYMAVTGLKLWDLAVLLPRSDFRIYTVPRDDGIIDNLRQSEGDFWHQNVLAKVPPEIDYTHSGALDAVKKRFALINEETIEITDQNLAASLELCETLKMAIKLDQQKIDAIKAEALDRMGSAGAAIVGGRYTLTRKVVKRGGYSVEPKEYVDFKIKEIRADGR
jgi:putative phage-type endonuclease